MYEANVMGGEADTGAKTSEVAGFGSDEIP
jgi:hypothetical protein